MEKLHIRWMLRFWGARTTQRVENALEDARERTGAPDYSSKLILTRIREWCCKV
jgi:hypothetical protein